MPKTPEEMLELLKKAKHNRYATEDNIQFDIACSEFVPYAAEWMIGVKELLNEIRNGLDVYSEDWLDKINQFLESPHEIK